MLSASVKFLRFGSFSNVHPSLFSCLGFSVRLRRNSKLPSNCTSGGGNEFDFNLFFQVRAVFRATGEIRNGFVCSLASPLKTQLVLVMFPRCVQNKLIPILGVTPSLEKRICDRIKKIPAVEDERSDIVDEQNILVPQRANKYLYIFRNRIFYSLKFLHIHLCLSNRETTSHARS